MATRRAMNARLLRAVPLTFCFIVAVFLAPARADTAHPTTLRIGYQRIGPLVILQQQHRLEQALAPTAVQWIEFASGPPLMEALNAGAIDFGYGGDTPPIFAAAAGVDFVFVAFQPLPGENEGLLLPPGSAITTVEGLRGHTIAVTKGSSAHNFIVRILAAHGMTPADVQLRYLQPSDAAAAFARGSVAAWAIWDPYFAIAERAPGVRLLTNGVGVAPSNNFFFARRSYAQDNPALIAQLVDEINGAAAWAHDHPRELASVMTAVTGVEPGAEAVAAARGAYTAAFLTPAVVAQEQAIADRFAALHIIPGAVDIAAHVYYQPEHAPVPEKRSE
jgi:sulfonate transport system substrate-binding protein